MSVLLFLTAYGFLPGAAKLGARARPKLLEYPPKNYHTFYILLPFCYYREKILPVEVPS